MSRECPRCKVMLVQVCSKGIELDACPTCHGVWFDSNELDIICESPISPEELIAEAKDEGHNLNCPKCNEGMSCTHFDKVEVDYCQKCEGIWLDSGELSSIQVLLEKLTDDGKDYELKKEERLRMIKQLKGVFEKQ